MQQTTAATVAPSPFMKIVSTWLSISMVRSLVTLGEIRSIPHLSRNEWLSLAACVLLAVLTIEFLTRKTVIDADRLRHRVWFRWSTTPLPASVYVFLDHDGRAAIADASGGSVVFKFGREYGDQWRVAQRVAAFFGQSAPSYTPPAHG